MTQSNPFRPYSPVWQPKDFFGRSRETRRVLQSLRHGQSVSIVGSLKRGKTSLLNYVADIEVFQRHALRSGKHIFVQIDVTDVRGYSLADLDQGECFYHLREEITCQIKESNVTVGTQLEKATRRLDHLTAHFGLRTLFRIAYENGLQPIVVLDNFDNLARNTRLEENFFSALRALATNYGTAFLVASRNPLHELEKIRREASTFFGICHQIVLDTFSPEESRELVTVSLERIGVQFPSFAIAHILELGNNEPYRLQLAGYHTFKVWQENGKRLRQAVCRKIESRFKTTLHQDLEGDAE